MRTLEKSPLQQVPGGGEIAPLGIYAKTSSAPSQGLGIVWAAVQDDSGEVVPFSRSGTDWKRYISPQQARAERFALKSVVNRIFPRSRTSKCCRWRVPKQDLQVHCSTEYGKAFYSGLEVCSSVWACPVCAGKISERRRVELEGAISTAKAMGWRVYLLTLTIPHGLGDDINLMLDQMMAAWRKLSSDRAGRALVADIGLQGTIRALEVTDGANGFHPHFHVLLFVNGDLTPKQVETRYTPLWQKACQAVGLPRPSDKHGCRVDDGSYAAAYASKWGLESEMTKGHTKQGKRGSMTPWDLLRAVLREKCERSRKRFAIYAEAFKGRRQLYWSNGLKAKLAVVDLSDEEIAAEQDDQALVLAELTDEQWRAVLATRSEAALLVVAETHPDALQVFLESLQCLARALSGGNRQAPPPVPPDSAGPFPANVPKTSARGL